MNRLITILFLVCPILVVRAADRYPATGSQADVQASIDGADPGDNIFIPADTNTWATQVTAVGMNIYGSGTNTTKITVNGSGRAFDLTNCTLAFVHVDLPSAGGGGTCVRVDGYDNMVFSNLFTAEGFSQAIDVLGKDDNIHPNGVAFENQCFNTRFLVDMQTLAAHTIWFTNETIIGSTNQFYFEDNTQQFDEFANTIDSNYGGSYCFRHNVVIDASLEAHSQQSYDSRGARSWEIYFNTIIQSNRSLNFVYYLRAGTGVVYSNEVIGTWSNPDGFINNIRSSEHRESTGYADGSSPWDANTTTNGASGTHNGSGNVSNLVDTSKSWTINEFVSPPIFSGDTHEAGNNESTLTDFNVNLDPLGFIRASGAYARTNAIVHNITDGSYGLIQYATVSNVIANLVGGTDNDWDNGDQYEIFTGFNVRNTTDGSISVVYSNSANTVYTMLSGGTDNDWDVSDNYEITDGYPARDQIGRGKDLSLGSGVDPSSTPWPEQSLDPAYFWGNWHPAETNWDMKISGGIMVQGHIQEGRDYYDNTVHPTYTALDYPHPLRSASETPVTTTRFQATGNTTISGNVELR